MSDILYILIIYGVTKEESRAWQCLQKLLPAEELLRNVYVHDNNVHNIYLAEAYNTGLQFASTHGFKYIVLLDHDACLTAEYISAIRHASTENQNAVWVPVLMSPRGKQISPIHKWGMQVAFNSGMLLPVKIVQSFGGFNTNYPLDYLDYWVCHQLYSLHIPLLTLPVTLEHSLSVLDYANVPKWRYLSLLAAEKRFANEIGMQKQYKIRLLGRLIKWSLTGHKYVKETWNAWIGKDE